MSIIHETRIIRRRNPEPVTGVARWIGGTPTQEQLNDGSAILKIAAAGKPAAFYYVEQLRHERSGRVLGYRLVKIDGLANAATYDVDTSWNPADPRTWTCDCPDHTFTERPGGCKHIRSLAEALKTVTN